MTRRFDIDTGEFVEEKDPSPRGGAVLNGRGAPEDSLGSDGDLYIDTAAWLIYGPKKDGSWGQGSPLQGKDAAPPAPVSKVRQLGKSLVITLDDVKGEKGDKGDQGKSIKGDPGPAGRDGVGIESVNLSGQEIVITLTTGEWMSFPVPKPRDGDNGQDGVGIVSITQRALESADILLSNGKTQTIMLPAGKDGREIELGTSSTHFQWRYAGSKKWFDLAPIPKATRSRSAGGGANYLRDLGDVSIVDLQDGEILVYDATEKLWKNATGGSGGYSDEMAQDAIGGILADTDTINATYTDATPEIKFDVRLQMSLTSDNAGLKLVGDSAAPGNSKYYGTNGAGVKGYYDLPTSGSDAVWGSITGTLSDQTDLQDALDLKANSADLATVATSGDYNDLINTPSIPTQYTDEMAQDAVGAMVAGNTETLIAVTYDDAGNKLNFAVTATLSSYTNDAGFITNLSGFNTGDLAEGSNLYFTNERVDDRVAALLQNGTGISFSYNDGANTLTPTVTLSPFSTTNLAEGSNLYFTDERAQDAIGAMLDDSGDIDFTYVDATPALSAVVKNDSITYAKMQNVSATDRLLGRSTSGTGDVEEIVCTVFGRSLIDDADASAGRTTLGVVIGTNVQAFDASLDSIAGVSWVQGDLLYFSGTDTAARLAKDTNATRYLSNTGSSNNPAWAQINLANGVTGDLPFANLTQIAGLSVLGVTGSSTADVAAITAANDGEVLRRSGTALAFGTISTSGIANDAVTYAKMQNVSATDRLLGRSTSGAGDVEEITCTAFGRSLIDDADASAGRTTLGVVIGTDVQAFDAELAAIAGLTSAADRLPYFTGLGTAALATFTSFGRSLVDDADASTARTTLGLVIGTDVAGLAFRTIAVSGQSDVVADSATDTLTLVAGANITITTNAGTDTITIASTGGATLGDGDYGDITASVSGTVLTIDNDVVTFAKMQNIATDRLIGRDTASTGDPEEITVGGGLEFTGSAGIQRSALTGDVTASAGSNSTTVISASDTQAGKVELATAAETTTGTDAARAVTPDGLAGSDYGKRSVCILVSDPNGSAISTGNGKALFRVPSIMNGYNLIAVAANLSTVSSSGAVNVMVRRSRRTNATTRSDADMLSTAITIDQSEFDTVDAATAAVINGSNDDVNTGDHIYIDIDGAGTGAKGLTVELQFQLP